MVKLNKILGKFLISMGLVISTMLLFAESSVGQSTNLQRENVVSDSLEYAYQEAHMGNPLEAGNVIAETVPKTGSIFDIGVGQSYFDWKDKIYDKIGLRFGFSYQLAYQSASVLKPGAKYDAALSDWWGFLIKWMLINKDKRNKGGLVFSMFDRNPIGNHRTPSLYGPMDIGSITSAIEFTEWDFAIENLYWEQWFGLGERSLFFRVGNQIAATLIDPFRFKDAKKSFTTGPFCYHVTKPDPTFGFGVTFKWLPAKGTGLYIAGAVTDMNGDPNLMGFDWSTVSRGEFFYGGEIGYNWVRGKGDYDHLHLLVFYADRRSTRNPDTQPNKEGGGFSVHGEKQIDHWVGFAKYTYNTAEGGGGAATFSNHTATAGVVYKNLLNISGDTGIGFYFMDPIDEIFGEDARNQTGIEVYWHVLLSRNIIVTPGIHLQFNPSLNPETDFVSIPHIKFRVQI
jgi:hypothetical protein